VPDRGLPFLDEHTRLVEAPPAAVWPALVARLATGGGVPTTAYATLVGAHPGRATGCFPDVGSALPGFAVSEADPPVRLSLTGRHRFSRYRLAFVLEPRGAATLVRAVSHAEFPGLHGRLYRAAVIESRAHVVLLRRLLADVDRRCRTARS